MDSTKAPAPDLDVLISHAEELARGFDEDAEAYAEPPVDEANMAAMKEVAEEQRVTAQALRAWKIVSQPTSEQLDFIGEAVWKSACYYDAEFPKHGQDICAAIVAAVQEKPE
jgi:hypothetical protein